MSETRMRHALLQILLDGSVSDEGRLALAYRALGGRGTAGAWSDLASLKAEYRADVAPEPTTCGKPLTDCSPEELAELPSGRVFA